MDNTTYDPAEHEAQPLFCEYQRYKPGQHHPGYFSDDIVRCAQRATHEVRLQDNPEVVRSCPDHLREVAPEGDPDVVSITYLPTTTVVYQR